MTGNLIVDAFISLAAIALMVLAAWLAFRNATTDLDEALARERLSFDEPDFRPRVWLFDDEGRAALAEGETGDFALVFRLGADLVTRRFPAGSVKARTENGDLIVRPADPGSRPIRLRAGEAAFWAKKIAGE